MLFPSAEKLLSTARLAPYKRAALGNEQACLGLYLDNLRLARSFYPSLALLEVAFRNSLHDVLTVSLNSENWLLTEQTGFMMADSLTYFDRHKGQMVTNQKALNMVKEAVREYKQQRNYAPASGAAIIAELPFGFWTSLFSKAYFLLLDKNPLRAFPHRPRGTTWETINQQLIAVRRFRNRVYHYEPLCFQQPPAAVLCFSQLIQMHRSIVELLGWISPELPAWAAETDLVPETLKKLQKKYPLAV